LERSNKAVLFHVSGVLNRKPVQFFSVFQGLNKMLLRLVITYEKKAMARTQKWTDGKENDRNPTDAYIT